jgi:uncharacterized protein YdeI (BOF family)
MKIVRPAVAACLMALALPISALAATDAAAGTAARAPADNVIAINDIRRGSMVTVQGTVERILDTDEFRLADGTGSIRVDVGYPNFVPVSEGERVTVRGFVDRGLIKEIYAREIVHANGSVSRLDRRQG